MRVKMSFRTRPPSSPQPPLLKPRSSTESKQTRNRKRIISCLTEEKTHRTVCVLRASNVRAFIRPNYCSVVVISHSEQQNGQVFIWKCCGLLLQTKFSPQTGRGKFRVNWCRARKSSAPLSNSVKTKLSVDICLLQKCLFGAHFHNLIKRRGQ